MPHPAPFRLLLVLTLLCNACDDGAAATDTEVSDDGADTGSEFNPPCSNDHQCDILGRGGMCMGGQCMLMDIYGPGVEQSAPSEQDISHDFLIDLDPDPDVFEANMVVDTAAVELVPGTLTNVFVYRDENGPPTIPGPLVDVTEGTLVRIHVTNRLDEPTTVHWHGLVLPNEMDGVPNHPIPPIEPGATYTYEFVARYPALYWYHPHYRSDVQIERGLYGGFMIRPAEGDPVVDQERVIVLDDLLLDENGEIEGPDEGSAHVVDETTGEVSMTFVGMMGRQGNRLLLNGQMNPIIDVVPGTVERWRIVNTANARFFNISIEGHTFIQIGSDAGLLETPRQLDEILIAPSERVDVLVEMTGDVSTEYGFVTNHHNRGHGMADPGPLPLGLVRYGADLQDPPTPVPPTAAVIEPYEESEPAHIIVMGETALRGGRVGFTLNDEMWPEVTPELSYTETRETWEIVNETHMDHPFHIHGTSFQVTSMGPINGTLVPVEEREWKDTVIVSGETTLRFVLSHENPGDWVYHCHIFEHANGGMMGRLEVTAQ